MIVLQFPSHSLQEAGIHGHFFVNGGTLSLLSGTGRSVQQVVTDDFMRSWRWTAVCRFLCLTPSQHYRPLPTMCTSLLAGGAMLVRPYHHMTFCAVQCY